MQIVVDNRIRRVRPLRFLVLNLYIVILKFRVVYLDVSEGSNKGENEWYYYCKRGRKYKNSVRPNRVTAGSGFWKATGIDKPIYGKGEVIGLKKSLVYYRGSAGKGTKTEWMMHEFRLPNNKYLHAANNIAQEAVRNFNISYIYVMCFSLTIYKCTQIF